MFSETVADILTIRKCALIILGIKESVFIFVDFAQFKINFRLNVQNYAERTLNVIAINLPKSVHKLHNKHLRHKFKLFSLLFSHNSTLLRVYSSYSVFPNVTHAFLRCPPTYFIYCSVKNTFASLPLFLHTFLNQKCKKA